MKNNNITLIKTLLLSTSQKNIYKYTTDKKKKKKIVGGRIGMFIVYLLIMLYCVMMTLGYAVSGLIDAAPAMCALTISILAFVFTLFKTNGYLFNFKEYDMLMSLPLDAGNVAGCKFLYMYIKTLPWYISISFAMMVGYGLIASPSLLAFPFWIILSFVLPIIPMLFASFLGFLIARVSAGFRKTNLIQTILTFVLVLFCFSFRYILEAVFRDGHVEETLELTSEIADNIGSIYLPVKWFSEAVVKQSVLSFLLLIVVSAALFTVLFYFVGKSYRNINSALKSHAAARNYKMTAQKKRSVEKAIAYKEFKRLTGSTTYITNCTIGELLSVILGIMTLIIGFDKIVKMVTQNAPFDSAILQPAIPFIVYFMVGMATTTFCSPSLEGKNYWIVQSLPIDKRTLYNGKMLFNMYLKVPFMTFAILCLCISAKVPIVNTLLYLILGFVLCAFSTTWGCVIGVKHINLEWENEVEVIKQGAASTLYILPNMFVVMILTVLVVYLGTFTDHKLLALIFIAIVSLLSFLSYKRAMALAGRT